MVIKKAPEKDTTLKRGDKRATILSFVLSLKLVNAFITGFVLATLTPPMAVLNS
jgi:hypothetical protein